MNESKISKMRKWGSQHIRDGERKNWWAWIYEEKSSKLKSRESIKEN